MVLVLWIKSNSEAILSLFLPHPFSLQNKGPDLPNFVPYLEYVKEGESGHNAERDRFIELHLGGED